MVSQRKGESKEDCLVRERQSYRNSKRRRQAIAAGLCHSCKKLPPVKGNTLCQECLDYLSERRRQAIAIGLCGRCGKRPPVKGKTHCKECGDYFCYQSEKYKKRLRNNKIELLGDTCYFHELGNCKFRGDHELIGHEKSGDGHERGVAPILWGDPDKAIEFVHLCNRHHNDVHGVMHLFGLTWEEIVRHYKKHLAQLI